MTVVLLMQLARDYQMYTQCSWLLWSVCIVLCYSLSCLTYYGGIHFYVLGDSRMSQLTHHHENATLFLTTINPSLPQTRLVKLAVEHYREQVQRALAAVQPAPVLFGK